MSWLRHPVGFACSAAIAIAVAFVLPDVLTARRWHGGPLAVFTADSLAAAQQSDGGSAFAHVVWAFDAVDAIGVGVEIEPRDGGEALIGIRWRRSGEDDWYFYAQPHNLGRSRLIFRLDGDESWSGEIAELAVSPLHDVALKFRALRVEAAGPLAALERLWFELAAVETYRQSSLNWLGGMRVGGVDWSWWMALVWLAYCGWRLASTGGRLAARDWQAIAARALLLWVAADIRFTANLLFAAVDDVARFPSPLSAESADGVVATADPLYREVVRQVRDHVPPDAKLGFVTADPSLLIRSRYVFYPRQVVHPPRRWIAERPEYVALLGDDQIRYLPDREVLRWGQFGRLPVRPIARLGDRAGLFQATPSSADAAAPGRGETAHRAIGIAPLLLAVAAQLVITAIGGAWVWARCGTPRRSNATQWAAAYALGAVLTTCAMALAGLAGVPFRRPWLAAGAAVLIAVAVGFRRRSYDAATETHPTVSPRLPAIARAGLASLLAVKVGFVLVELLHRPITGWDSFAVWTLRAKVWAARGGLVLDRGDWFFYGGAARPDYPPHISLLQTWTGVWIGDWHDVLVNLPWGFYYLSLLAFCYCATAPRLGRDWALATTFALAGIPLVVVHAALGGYADLVLATHFLLAAALLWQPQSASDRRLGFLFALSLPLIKLEGIPLAAACLAIAGWRGRMGSAPRRNWLFVAVLTAAAVAAALANQTLRNFLASAQMQPQGLQAVADGLFRDGNWHFLWALFVAVAAMRLRSIWNTSLAWMLFNLVAAALPLSFALLFTDASAFASARSADSRLFLSLAPAALVFVALALGDASRDAPQQRASGANATSRPRR